jgi:hypothetical protein
MNFMNTKRLIFLACFALVVFSASLALAGGRGHSSSARPSAFRPAIVQSASRFTPTARNSTARVQRWNGNWNSINRNVNRRTNWGRWDGRHCGRRTRFVFVGSFGFPGYYSYPYYYGYPYSYYPYSYYPSGYYSSSYYPSGGYYEGGDDSYNGDSAYYNGSRYGRGSSANGSMVTQVQRMLANEGYYKGDIDGELGPRTHYAIRAYQRTHNLPVDGTITSRLLERMGLR